MQTKIKSSESNIESESGMVVERRFTSAGQIRSSRSNGLRWTCRSGNPDGSMADSLEGVNCLRGFCVLGTVCAQKYLRKAGVPKYLRNVPEDDVPVWLQRSERSRAASDVDAAERMVRLMEDSRRRLAGTWTYQRKHGYCKRG